MVERIAWLNLARDQYREVVTYLFDHYSEGAIDRFDARFTRKLNLIRKQPECGHPSSIEGVRSVTIGGRHRLYYRYHNDTICLIFLWDNRKDPKKNPF